MTSIFDQYEATMSRGPTTRVPVPSGINKPEPISSGYINTRLEEETPIFNKSKISFKPQEPISHLSICNNMLCMVMSSRILLRINLQHPDDVDEIEISKNDNRISKVFFDPSGHFLLITLSNEETLFLSSNSHKPKSLNKFRGHKIESVAWCRTATGNSTGPVLVGTSWGLIMECAIDTGEDTKFFGGSVDQYLKQVYNIAKGDAKGASSSVLGLEYFCTAVRDNDRNDYCIFAVTPTRLFQFSGTINTKSSEVPVFNSVFSSYQKSSPRVIDLPGDLSSSQLFLMYDTKNNSGGALNVVFLARVPIKFAWLAAPGIYVGDVRVPPVTDESALPQRSMITNAKLISFPDTTNDVTNPFADPDEMETVVNVVLTDFHVLLMYSDRVKIVCVLNEQIIFEDVYLSRYGQLLGLIKDPTQGTVWTYTDKSVFKYKVVKESRDVWQMYLDMGKFDLAREFCRDNPANLDKVLTRQAQNAFEEEKYQESAMYYAITQNSFEEIALKFIRQGQEGALRTFLLKKLAALKSGELIQMTMLSSWLVELHLNHIGKLKESDEHLEELTRSRENFRKFLAQGKLRESFEENRSTIYDLLISHGDVDDYIFFAVLMKDYERVVNYHIQNEDYISALHALQKQDDIKLYYRFSPILMQNSEAALLACRLKRLFVPHQGQSALLEHVPKQAVDAWIALGRRIEPRQLIPSLVNCTQTSTTHEDQWLEAVRYLEHCTNELFCTEQAIHNYLLSLYVKHKPEAMLIYLNEQGDDASDVNYDVKYALRLCLSADDPKLEEVMNRACVIIYTVLKLYEEAVSTALKVDVELAKSIADRSELEDEDEELRKKLWLRIAKHVVQEEKDIKRAMKFLHDSGDLLKIEDILPFFPDFVTIDHFKDALCESLAEYNKQIDDLKEEMNDANASAQSIRTNIQDTKNRHLVVGETERCTACERQLLTRSFYIFPCHHAFHQDCLFREVRPLLDPATGATLDQIQQDLLLLNQSQPASTEEVQRQRRQRQRLIAQLDQFIASECVLCGNIAVEAIDKPFYEEGDTGGWL